MLYTVPKFEPGFRLSPIQAAQWGGGTMGSTFLKAIYREYTGETFTERKAQEHTSDAMAGPVLRGEVGDMITVVFKVHPLTWELTKPESKPVTDKSDTL
jgi:hypothetical protein